MLNVRNRLQAWQERIESVLDDMLPLGINPSREVA